MHCWHWQRNFFECLEYAQHKRSHCVSKFSKMSSRGVPQKDYFSSHWVTSREKSCFAKLCFVPASILEALGVLLPSGRHSPASDRLPSPLGKSKIEQILNWQIAQQHLIHSTQPLSDGARSISVQFFPYLLQGCAKGDLTPQVAPSKICQAANGNAKML